MSAEAVKLPTVERLIATRRSFPPALRAQFERDTRERHVRRLTAVIWPTLIVYNLLLVTDVFLVRDVWQVSAFIHFVIVTPLVIVVALTIPRLQSRLSREIAAAILPLAMSLQILFVFAASTSPFVDHY
ncbi:MAG: hypothetical protein JOZ16_06400, partial [Methylobacteriaceae bacterium]|nr:hypothetical protein [Methylobacteriaceae bacterium]